MIKGDVAKAIIFSVIATLLLSCRPLNNGEINQNVSTVQTSCPALPPSFKESDLIGTWAVSYSLHDEDTLILNDDGTYKQIYENLETGQRYESSWQKWELEQRKSGYARLHLYGMHRAGEIDSIFLRKGGGIDPELFTAIDYCENVVVEMPDEIILIVTGTDDNVPRNITLRQTRLAGSEWTWSFILKNQGE